MSIVSGAARSVNAEPPKLVIACDEHGCTSDQVASTSARGALVIHAPGASSISIRHTSDTKDVPVPRCAPKSSDFCIETELGSLAILVVDKRPTQVQPRLSAAQAHRFEEFAKKTGEIATISEPPISALAASIAHHGKLEFDESYGLDSNGTPTLPPEAERRLRQRPSDSASHHVQFSDGHATPPEHVPTAQRAPADGFVLPLDDDTYPDIVAVGVGLQMVCSGIAIAPSYVLTARHCGAPTSVVLASDVTRPLVFDQVAKLIPAAGALDLELLQLVAPLPITAHARRSASDTTAPTGPVRVIGFGISNFHNQTGFGTKRAFEIDVDGWGCDGARPKTTGCLPDTELVLPPTNGYDTCNGDSGGAVFELSDAGDEWRLLAITSRAAGTATTTCGRGGIYERVDVAAAWLDSAMKRTP